MKKVNCKGRMKNKNHADKKEQIGMAKRLLFNCDQIHYR